MLDAVITAAAVPGRRAPLIVTRAGETVGLIIIVTITGDVAPYISMLAALTG